MDAIRKVSTPQFREELKDIQNPYGHGEAAEKIVDIIKNVSIDDRLLLKKFYML